MPNSCRWTNPRRPVRRSGRCCPSPWSGDHHRRGLALRPDQGPFATLGIVTGCAATGSTIQSRSPSPRLATASSSRARALHWLPMSPVTSRRARSGAQSIWTEWIDHVTHTRFRSRGDDPRHRQTSVVQDFDGRDDGVARSDGTAVWRVPLVIGDADADQSCAGASSRSRTPGASLPLRLGEAPPPDVASPCTQPVEAPKVTSSGTRPSTPDPEDRPRTGQWDTVADVILAGDAVPTVRLVEMPVVIIVPGHAHLPRFRPMPVARRAVVAGAGSASTSKCRRRISTAAARRTP